MKYSYHTSSVLKIIIIITKNNNDDNWTTPSENLYFFCFLWNFWFIEEILHTNEALWWSDSGNYLAVAAFDETNVSTYEILKFGDDYELKNRNRKMKYSMVSEIYLVGFMWIISFYLTVKHVKYCVINN